MTVIPTKVGIQDFKKLENHLDPGFHRGDNFLQVHHYWIHTLLRTTPFRIDFD